MLEVGNVTHELPVMGAASATQALAPSEPKLMEVHVVSLRSCIYSWRYPQSSGIMFLLVIKPFA